MELTNQILNIITSEIAEIMNSKPEYYGEYSVEISEEQQYYKMNRQDPGKIYIVVKFLDAPLNFEQIIMPINIQAISEQDKLEVCRTLLFEFASKYNLYKMSFEDEDQTMQQYYNSPYVLSNFNEIFEGFRSLLFVSGTFLITNNANYCTAYFSPVEIGDKNKKEECVVTLERELNGETFIENLTINLSRFKKKLKKEGIKLEDKTYQFILDNVWKLEGKSLGKDSLYDYGIKNEYFVEKNDIIKVKYTSGWQKIECLSVNAVCDISLDSQPFFDNDNFVESVGKFGTFSFNITSYLFKNDFLNKCLAVWLRKLSKAPMGINTDFNLLLEFDDDDNYVITKFKLSSFSLQEVVGDIPLVSITFSI